MKATARRLAALEAAQTSQRDALAIPQWLALYRAGADVHSRNAVAGAAWCEAAAERERLAIETLELYENT